jgi:GTP-binding protein HflX
MTAIGGTTHGLKKSDLVKLEKLYRRKVGKDELFSADLAEELCELSLTLKRAIGILMNSKGHVHWVFLGELDLLHESKQGWKLLPDIDTPPKIIPYSCFYVPSGKPLEDEEHIPLGAKVTALQFRFTMLGILVKDPKGTYSQQHGEHPEFCDGAYLLSPTWSYDTQQPDIVCQKRVTPKQLGEESFSQWLEWGESVMSDWTQALKKRPRGERAFIVSVDDLGTKHQQAAEFAMAELIELAKTAGASILGEMHQKRFKQDSKSYLGQGKAEELALMIQQEDANLLIANDTLSPVQQRTLEALTRVKVIDRTELILDIFAQRARSREGQIQVELAQYQYLLPRLIGRGRTFSQQTSVGAKGGIATRGPGETKLETDRRLIHQRIDRLEEEANTVVAHRQLQRSQRQFHQKLTAALVGYTNAGKSTLLKRLTGADVLVENQLFATLDPTTRRLYLPNGMEILLTDTVGFIQKLPTFLVKAFRGTLEEVKEADLILHVWDVSHPDKQAQYDTVLETLEELGALEVPRLTLCNKIDVFDTKDFETGTKESVVSEILQSDILEPILISAHTGENQDGLLTRLSDKMAELAELKWTPSQASETW